MEDRQRALSASQARRIALSAQGFGNKRPTGRVDRRHLRKVLDHIGLQRADIPSDPHAEFAHWSAMAVFATLVVLWGLIGATELTGRRITAWLTGVSAVTFGVASLVFPNLPSAAGVGWAVAAVAWGAGYLVLTEREARRRSARQGVGVPR